MGTLVVDTNQSSLSLSQMNDDKLIMAITLSYLIVSLLIHILFYLTTIFNHQWRILNILRHLFHRYFKQKYTKKMNTVSTSSLDTNESESSVLQNETFITEKILSVSSSSISIESETILIRSIRSYGFFLCTILLITNWFRMSIYLFSQCYPNLIQDSSNLCLAQSFFLHVLTLFHLILTISIRLFWHYCFIFNKSWQTLTYSRLFIYFLCIFFCLCLFTWPSLIGEWASIKFDRILNICIVNYTFHFSYTFFILSLTCCIPFLLLIISHYEQMKSIKRRMEKYFSTISIESSQPISNITHRKNQFQYASYVILIWSLINIILLICIHTPMENRQIIRSIIYYIQMFALILDPILYMFIFRSLAIIALLRPTDEFYFYD